MLSLDHIVEMRVTRDMIAKLRVWEFSPLAAMQLDMLLLSLEGVVSVQCSCFRRRCIFSVLFLFILKIDVRMSPAELLSCGVLLARATYCTTKY